MPAAGSDPSGCCRWHCPIYYSIGATWGAWHSYIPISAHRMRKHLYYLPGWVVFVYDLQCYPGTANGMLGEISGVAKIYIVTGYTDMRKSIDGLMGIIQHTYEMDPFANALFLFCGRKCDRLKALHFDRDGFVLYYKRLDNGRYQWPRTAAEVRPLSRQEFRWLLEGLSIDQPKAIRTSSPGKQF